MFYFSWTVDDIERYATTCWLPDIEQPDGGRRARTATFDTLDGEALVLRQGRDGCADQRGPGRFTLKWEVADAAFLRIAEEDYMRGWLITVRLDHRWRRLMVTAQGGNTVCVAAGYALSGDDTCWLTADAVLSLANGDTKVWATLHDGMTTPGHGTVLPDGAILLAEVTVSSGIVAITSTTTGVANARRVQIIEFETTPVPGGLTGLRLGLQEVR